MEVDVVNRGSSLTNFIQSKVDVTNGAHENLAADPAANETDAVTVEITAAAQTTEIAKLADVNDQFGPLSRVNEAILATLSPEIAKKYFKLIDLVSDDRERLKNFIQGVSQSLTKLNIDSESSEAPLAVGHSVSTSFSSHLDAVFAASKDGAVESRRFALSITLAEDTLQNASNQNDPIEVK